LKIHFVDIKPSNACWTSALVEVFRMGVGAVLVPIFKYMASEFEVTPDISKR